MSVSMYEKLLASLDRRSMLSILLELCKDADIRKTVVALAKTNLKSTDFESIEDDVFCCLDNLDVVTLWQSSGKGYYGYKDPTDVATEMMEEAIEPFAREAIKRHDLKMYHEEKEYCAAIVRGLLRYAEEGGNEFRGWVPDDPYNIADDIVYKWAKRNPEADDVTFRAELGL